LQLLDLEVSGQKPLRLSSQARSNVVLPVTKVQAASGKQAKQQQQSPAARQKQQPQAMSGLAPPRTPGNNSKGDDDDNNQQPSGRLRSETAWQPCFACLMAYD
jgi:hypothetical protein